MLEKLLITLVVTPTHTPTFAKHNKSHPIRRRVAFVRLTLETTNIFATPL